MPAHPFIAWLLCSFVLWLLGTIVFDDGPGAGCAVVFVVHLIAAIFFVCLLLVSAILWAFTGKGIL